MTKQLIDILLGILVSLAFLQSSCVLCILSGEDFYSQWMLDAEPQNSSLSRQFELMLPFSLIDKKIHSKFLGAGIDLVPFSLQLYNEMISNADSNVIVSPISVATALAMTWQGAKGRTAVEIEKVLQLKVSNLKGTLDGINKRSGGTILLANRAFIQDGFKVLGSYKAALKQNYNAETNQINFMNQRLSMSVINDWVKRVTRGHIPEVVSDNDIDQLTQFIVVNVVFFKNDWQNRFDPIQTRVSNFYITPEEFVRVPMMKLFGEFKYKRFDLNNFEMLEMPYKDNVASMYVILPDHPNMLSAVQRAILEEPSIISGPELYLRSTNISVVFPKFSINSVSSLKPVLQRMGMSDMFMDGRADFSGISNNGAIAVGNVIHQVKIDVDEHGSVSSAATAMVYKGRSAFADPNFNVNRPFIFFIRDNKSKTILFTGHVKNPTAIASIDRGF